MTLPAALDAMATSTVPTVCVVRGITLWAMPVAEAEGRVCWWHQGGVVCVPCGVVQPNAALDRSGGLHPGGLAVHPSQRGASRGAPRCGAGGPVGVIARAGGGEVAAAPRKGVGTLAHFGGRGPGMAVIGWTGLRVQ